MHNWIITKVELDVNKNEVAKYLYKLYSVNSKGQTLDETEFDSKAKTVFKRTYRYFEDGDVKEYVEYEVAEDFWERHLYFKNKFKEVDKVVFEYSGGVKAIKTLSFTDLGNADKATIVDEKGEITGYEVYVLGNEGQVLEEMYLDQDEVETAKFEKTYYENGLLHSEKHLMNGELVYIERFEYDQNENVITKRLKNYIDNYLIIDNYSYDERGNMIHNISYQNDILIFENTCKYDSANYLIQEEFFQLDFWEGRIIKHERLIHELKNEDE